jgi:uncharacterized repeat protein (TIGR02543 family)
MAGTAFSQEYVDRSIYKYYISNEDDVYRNLRIQVESPYAIDSLGVVRLVSARIAGDPRIVEIIEVYPEDQTKKYEAQVGRKVRRWKVGEKTTIQDIMKDDWHAAVYKVRAPSNGFFVEFACWGGYSSWTKVSNRKFGVVLPGSSIRVAAGGGSVWIDSGAVGWDEDFQAASNLDEYMEYLAKKVNYDWVKKKVDSLKKNYFNRPLTACPEDPSKCGCKGDINEHIILNATNKAMGWGAVWGLAPPWLMPAEFVNVYAQYMIQSYLAAAIGYSYGRFQKGGDAFTSQLKLDNYVLFADTEAGEHLSDIGKGMLETTATEIVTFATKIIMKKIAPKGLSAVPVVGTVWGVGKGTYDGYKYAQQMGRRAVEFYNNLPEFDFEPTTGKISRYNFKDKNVKVPAVIKNRGMVKAEKVIAIGKEAFANNSIIETITLDGNVETIEAGAFKGCTKLKTVTINAPEITIADNAFNGCSSLTTVNIPKGARKLTIGANAFNGTNLTAAVKARIREFGYTGAGVGGNISVTVTFNANGGSAPNPANKKINAGSAYGNMPNVSRPEHTFSGWYTQASGGTLVGTSTTVTNEKDHTLYARWSANGITVTFNPNGGSEPKPKDKGVTPGNAYGSLPTNVIKSGYKLDGWYTQADGGTKVDAKTTMTNSANHTLYAHWIVDSQLVTFNPNGGSAPNPKDKGINPGSTYGTLPTTSRSGYTFDGWYTQANGGTKVDSNTHVSNSKNHTLYAHWIADKKPDPPKQTAQQPAAQKQEAPKPAAQKQEAPKPAAPKQEAPKPAAPKQEAPKKEAPKQEAPKKEAPKPAAQTNANTTKPASAYSIGDKGPNGGIVFDKGKECTSKELGQVAWADADKLAKGNGSGWRLPTKAELNAMYNNLQKNNKGGFKKESYWGLNGSKAYAQNFGAGNDNASPNESEKKWVRAVRSF